MEARLYGCNGSIHYEFEWRNVGLKPTANAGGTTGFAAVISRSGGAGGVAAGTEL